MKPRVTLRKALEDPELLGAALAGIMASLGQQFQRFTGRTTPPPQRIDDFYVASADVAARAERWRSCGRVRLWNSCYGRRFKLPSFVSSSSWFLSTTRTVPFWARSFWPWA